MGVILMLIAALFVALQNLFFRRSMDGGGTAKAYLMVQLFLTFLVAILLSPVRTGHYEWNFPLAFFGFCGGILLAAFLAMMGKALESGPPGLIFAVINASSVMPVLVMVTLFGAGFGFIYTAWNAVGSSLVVLGLFWAAKEALKEKKGLEWIFYALFAFMLHTLFLVFMQWRVLFLHFSGEKGLFLSLSSTQAASEWFMPTIFLAAALVQGYLFFTTEKRSPLPAEIGYGVLGGIANGIGTFFMIRATEVSSSLEQAMIFPIWSITVIVLCNLWGQRLYKERVNWAANACCIAGLLVGTIDWKALVLH